MKIFKSRWHVALSVSFAFGVSSVFAEEDLPPPPSSEEMPAIEDTASSGADLPPPPESSAPAEVLPDAPDMTADSNESPPLEEPLPEVPTDELLSDAPPGDPMTPQPPPEFMQASEEPSRLSTRAELSEMSMDEKLKSKELVLWLSGGPSYGSLQTKGTYAVAATPTTGGLGYSAGIGGMLTDAFQIQFDFMGTPRTERQTVDHAMFGFGPRLGFISLMGLFGVQQGVNLAATGDSLPMTKIFAIGAKGGLDIVLSHSKDSRMSVGLAPEAFYITTQGDNGYTNAGISVSLRIYGYENAF